MRSKCGHAALSMHTIYIFKHFHIACIPMILHNESGTKTQNAQTAEMCTLIFHFSSDHHSDTRHVIDSFRIFYRRVIYSSQAHFPDREVHWFKLIGLIVWVRICHAVRFFAWLWTIHNFKHLIFLLDLVLKWNQFVLYFGPFFPYLKIVHSTAKVQIHDQMPLQKVKLYNDYSTLLFSKNECAHFGWNCMCTMYVRWNYTLKC